MSSVSGWILSIAGVCLLSVIIDLILPDGRMNSHIKKVFSYIIILVVLMPLPNIIKSDMSLSDVFSEVEINIQDEYIYNINQKKLDAWNNTIESELEKSGIYGVEVSISANIFDVDMKIDAVYVDLYNVVINGNDKNIDIKTEVVSVVLSIINIKEEMIVFYE